jgi:hypothetical protein
MVFLQRSPQITSTQYICEAHKYYELERYAGLRETAKIAGTVADLSCFSR